ncbi:RNA helicase, nucleoside-triphosphatase [Trachipleistophora hominis]|uniref:RNA helicase, nucleoside-triphosphatase n=1 Tax=Trachipleistophora hominis TaxID=72359 RepID=L7JUT5_TRAHO|nr:RNA helicase, nucleoside-triphosphatase [Trachipleistophora hominis]
MSVARAKKNLEKYEDKRRKDALRSDLYKRINMASTACCPPEQNILRNENSKRSNKADCSDKQGKKRRDYDKFVRDKNPKDGNTYVKKHFCEKGQETLRSKDDLEQLEEFQHPINDNGSQYGENGTKSSNEVAEEKDKAQIYGGFCYNRREKVKRMREKLPIVYQEDEIISLIREKSVVLIIGSTGCGKSTQVPQMLLENNFKGILMTQPRRISCVSISERINYETNEQVAAYRFRFNNNVTPTTRIQVVTDGILLNEMIKDAMLSKFNVIIVDEVHELTINLEILLPLLSRLVQIRKDLKIILMSATPNDKIANVFSDHGEINLKSALYSVAVHYSGVCLQSCLQNKPEMAEGWKGKEEGNHLNLYNRIKNETEIIDRVVEIVNKKEGSILVFLTSKTQIYSLIRSLKGISDQIELIPLHASLPLKNQQMIYSNKRKCVLATNYAETGLTIPGIKYVIDCGYEKNCVSNGTLRSYPVVPISRASAEQRKGRAGRTGAGECYRMYSPVFYEGMRKFNTPQVESNSLDHFLLVLFHFKVKHNVFINRPDNEKLERSRKVLERIGAVKNLKITKLGRLIVKYPFEPRLSVILLKYDFNEIKLIISILDSDIEIRREDFEHFYQNETSDLLIKAKIILFCRDLNDYRENNHKERLNTNKNMFEMRKEVSANKTSNLRGKVKDLLEYDNLKEKKFNFTEDVENKIAKILFVTYHDHLCRRIHDEYYFNGKQVHIDRNSKDVISEYFVFQYLTERNGKLYAVNVTDVDKEWLKTDNLNI